MKKIIVLFLSILVLIVLIKVPFAYTSTLYSNDFKTNFGFNTSYGTCGPSSQGLTCSGAVGIYATPFSTVQCLSSTINVTSKYANLLFENSMTVGNDLGLEIKSGQNMRVLKTVSGTLTGYDTGQQPATGWQDFKICQDTSSLTAYYNNSLIYTLPFSHSIYPYVGFYLDPNVILTNFTATDSSSTSLYSNDFKTNFGFNTTGTCGPSSQGLTCSSGTVGIYTATLSTLKCLSSSIDVTSAYANLLFFNGITGGDDLGLEIKSGQNMRVLKTVSGTLTGYDTGQQPSTGWQNFMICQDTSGLTAYYNNSLIYTLSFGHSIYPVIGFYLDPNVILTNFIATDTNPNNAPPIINPISNATVNEGATYTANGSFTDTDSTSWTATVNYGDGTGAQSLTLNGMNFSLSHQYKDEGTYTVTVKVIDNQGATGTGTATITVNNATPSVGTITTPTTIGINTSLTASANFTDTGVLDTHTASWNWGDGNTTTGTVTESNGSGSVSNTHTYATAGSFTITLSVTDDKGLTGTRQTTIAVSPSGNGSLAGVNLTGLNYSGANLSNQNISGSNLKNGTFTSTNFQNANLSGVDAKNVSFQNANFTGANLAGSNFSGANFTNANMTGANLTGANFKSAIMTGVTWSNTICPDGTNSNIDNNTCIGHGGGL